MAYHGYIPFVKQYLSNLSSPSVLEIGIDNGVTTIPLTVFMTRFHKEFELFAVDAILRETFVITMQNIDYAEGQNVSLFNDSSLNVLPQLASKGKKFDVVLIDGDHNYYTVKRELSYLNQITHSDSLVIVDDYYGTWSTKDGWLKEDEIGKNTNAADKVETEKQGVKPAVDEFLEASGEWEMSTLMKGEPVVLRRKKNYINQPLFVK